MRKIYLIPAVLLILAVSSCKKYFDVNTDPATPQDPASKSLVAPLFAQMERGVQYDSRYVGGIIQYFGGNVNAGETHGYIPASDAAGEIWRTNYFGLGSNLNIIISKSASDEEWNYVGLAQALKAWSWQITTDYHGEIILKQAFEPNRYVFDYDSQEDVYAEVVRLAQLSIENFSRTDGKGTTEKLAPADLVYQGNKDKWIRFNYGLLARNAGNLINKASYDPRKVIEYVDKSLTGNADNFVIPNDGTTSVNGNFFGPLRANLGAYRQTNLMAALLDGTIFAGKLVIDPRRNNMITASADGVFRGTRPGMSDQGSAANRNQVPNPWGTLASANPGAGKGKYLFKDNAGFPVMTYSEMQFIKSEAAFRMGDRALAYDAYIKGISASIDFVSALGTAITSTEKAAYLGSESVRQSAANLSLADIMYQKYLALYGYGFVETWSDLRKYNYNLGDTKGNNPYAPFFVFPGVFFSDNGGKPAQRFRPRYNSEYLWNIESLKKIGADQPDYHTKKVWFTEP